MEDALDSFHANLPACLKWNEHDPPADNDILDARLRAKQYGAQVITYRPFILKILEFHDGGHANGVFPIKMPAGLRNAPTTALANAFYNPSENDPRSAQYLEYAQKGIRALINSTRAFWGMKGRLIVTNVWGTVTAYVPHSPDSRTNQVANILQTMGKLSRPPSRVLESHSSPIHRPR